MIPSPSSARRKCVRSLGRVPRVAPLLFVLSLLAAAALTLPPRVVTGARQEQSQQNSSDRQKRFDAAFVPGEILVRFRSDKTAKSVSETVSALSVEGREIPMKVERFEGSALVAGLRVARVADGDTLSAVEALRARADVLYAEPNYVRRKYGAPNDPRFADQWALKNGTAYQSNPDIDAEQAWDITTGSRQIVVGVVDEGFDTNHADLRNNVWTNPAETPANGADDDGNGFTDDVHGWDFYHNDSSVFDGAGQSGVNATDAHGTHVAGIVGAEGNNAAGVSGINWQVSLMSLKILPKECTASNPNCDPPAPSSVAVTLRAFQYAKLMRDTYVSTGGARGANLRVLNNSYGGTGRSQAEADAIRALGESGILFVAAAGNEQVNNDIYPSYPCNYDLPNVISVAASGMSGSLAGNFSNYGRKTVHLLAPGAGVLSTVPGNSYAYADGTSMAAPHVSGAAALLLAKSPGLSVARLRAALLYSGVYTDQYSFNTVTGRRLNALSALQNLDESDTTAPAAVASLNATNNTLGLEIRLTWTAPGDDDMSGRAAVYEVRFSDTDMTTPAEFEHGMKLYGPIPQAALASENYNFNMPYRHAAGYFGIRAVDNVGNAGPIKTIRVSSGELAADPYVMTNSAAAPLSTGGTPLGLVGDDKYKTNYQLPFSMPFYGFTTNAVTVSTNGVIYMMPGFDPPPVPLENGGPGDAFGYVDYLTARKMVAGVWDDLRTDRRAGDDVYVVQPDADRVIFRWQAVTFDTPLGGGATRGENPVNFEIELRRDGTIISRYGEGNHNLVPVVGLSAGLPEAYVAQSHTSEDSFKDLTNAPTVTYERRTAQTTPSTDLELQMLSSGVVMSGKQMTYVMQVYNRGGEANNVSLTDPLPAGTTFVSCTAFQGTCAGPAPGTNGTVTAAFGTLRAQGFASVSVTVQVTAAPGAELTNTAALNTSTRDVNPSNNTVTVRTNVVADDLFTGARSVSARARHTLALKHDRTVWGWGSNETGTLYDGSQDESKILPAQISNLSDVVAVANGSTFALALKTDGTVWAWGGNTAGQLGSPDAKLDARNAPVQVKGLTNIKSIAAGGGHALALRSDGTVWAWGANTTGQLGVGVADSQPHLVPLNVPGLSNVKSIAAGAAQSAAVQEDGTLWLWGANYYGLAGKEQATHYVASPTQMDGLAGVRSISFGDNTAHVIKNDGTLWSWGWNLYGLFGDGTNNHVGTHVPVQANHLTEVVDVAAGYTFAFAVKADGTLWAWGQNAPPSATSTPVQMSGIAGVSGVTAGTAHAAAVRADGTVIAWGANDAGQLGDGTTQYHSTWTDVRGLARVATPRVTPNGGTFWPSVEAAFACDTPGAVIRYTVNTHQDPTESDAVIASGAKLQLSADAVIRVKAWKNGMIASAAREVRFSVFNQGTFPNPIDEPFFFVFQHYRDFLNREADPSGLQFWTNEITQCGANAGCVDSKRVRVSGAFFLSIEFQETGYLVYRLNKASFGQRPRFQEFMADTRQISDGVVVNTPGWQQKIEANKQAFLKLWLHRVDYKALYDGKSNAEFINALYANAGVTPTVAERDALVAGLDNQTETRASVLLKVAEHEDLKRQEKNNAFVQMQYFGYLRRDPDEGGFQFWLKKLLDHNGDHVSSEMVRSFIVSGEYRARFGRP